MPYRIERKAPRRGFYGLLVAGAVSGILSLGVVVSNSVDHNTNVADQALLKAQQAEIRTEGIKLNELATRQAEASALQAKALATATAEERSQAILTVCHQQNVNHVQTIKQLHKELAAYERSALTAAQRRALNLSVQGTVLLIDKLAPKQNCQKVLATLSRP